MDTLDDVDIEDEVETELDVETLEKNSGSCLKDNKNNGRLTFSSWVLDANITTGIRANKTYCYLEEVDTLDDVDIDDDVDTELEVDTLKTKENCSFKTI